MGLQEDVDILTAEIQAREPFKTSVSAGYDGDPNHPSVPPVLQNAPLGTWYHREGTDSFYRKNNNGYWMIQDKIITTIEPLELHLNPDTGQDPPENTCIRILTQAQADAYGKFATVQGASRVLPQYLAHRITVIIDDGTYSALPVDFFGGLARFVTNLPQYAGTPYSGKGGIDVRSVSKLVKIGGTVTSDVASIDTEHNSIVLSADPGYITNEHRAKWLVVSEGTGVGEYKAIRSHSGVNFEVAGRFYSALDTSSKVEIHEPAVSLTFDSGSLYIPMPVDDHSPFGGTQSHFLQLSGIRIVDNNTYIRPINGSMEFDAVNLSSTLLCVGHTHISLYNLITEASWYGVYLGNSFIVGGSSENSWLIRGATTGIGSDSATSWPSIHLAKGAIDDCTTGVIIAGTQANLYNACGINNGTGVFVQPGGRFLLDISSISVYGGINGTVALNLAGLQLTIAELANLRGATTQLSGSLKGHVRVLSVEDGTATGSGSLGYISSTTTLSYTAPGDSAGTGVNVGAGGNFILKSNNGKWIGIWVNPTLPTGDQSDSFTIGREGAVVENNSAILELY